MSTPSDPKPPTPDADPAQPTTTELPVTPPASARTTIQQLPPPSAPVPPPGAAQKGATAAQQGAATAQTGTAAPHAGTADPAQPTGPVGFVPGFPDPATPGSGPSPEETGGGDDTAAATAPRDRTGLVPAGLVLLSLVLLQFGLVLEFGTVSFWSALPLWSLFATGCVLLGLAASSSLLPAGRRPAPRTGWRIAAGGLTGLAVFWVLVVLPNADSDRGFLHTAALAALGGAVWLAAGRDD